LVVGSGDKALEVHASCCDSLVSLGLITRPEVVAATAGEAAALVEVGHKRQRIGGGISVLRTPVELQKM
jgi:hypothetical protein